MKHCSLYLVEIMRSNGFCLANTETIVFDHSIPEEKERPSSTDSVEHTWVLWKHTNTEFLLDFYYHSVYLLVLSKIVIVKSVIIISQFCIKFVVTQDKCSAWCPQNCIILKLAIELLRGPHNWPSTHFKLDRKCVWTPLPSFFVLESKEEHIPFGTSHKTFSLLPWTGGLRERVMCFLQST